MPTVIDEVKFLRVKRVSETDLAPEYVYTIGVDEDHSYNVEGLICENCWIAKTNSWGCKLRNWICINRN